MLVKKTCKLTTGIYFILGLTFTSPSVYAQDELNDGPGILSGEKGHFSLSELFESNEKVDAITSAITSAKIDATADTAPTLAITKTDAQEFGLFKQWTQSKADNDAAYLEFKLWAKYQDYLNQQTETK
jgi:hypothetical protein